MTKDEASTTRGVDSDRDRERVDPRELAKDQAGPGVPAFQVILHVSL